jgi:hypothetical protein
MIKGDHNLENFKFLFEHNPTYIEFSKGKDWDFPFGIRCGENLSMIDDYHNLFKKVMFDFDGFLHLNGYKNFEEIMQLHLSNSATDEHAFVFLATDLTFEEAEPEDSEDLKVKKVHINEAFEMVMNGEITDGISVAAIFKVKHLVDKGELKI